MKIEITNASPDVLIECLPYFDPEDLSALLRLAGIPDSLEEDEKIMALLSSPRLNASLTLSIGLRAKNEEAFVRTQNPSIAEHSVRQDWVSSITEVPCPVVSAMVRRR